MNLTDLLEQRRNLLLKKSEGNATENDLKQLALVLDLISSAEPSITSEENKRRMEQDEKLITALERERIKPEPD